MFSSANGSAASSKDAAGRANVSLESPFGTPPLAGQNGAAATNGYGKDNSDRGVCNELQLLQQDKSNRSLDDKQPQRKRSGSKLSVELADGQSSLLRFHPPRSNRIASKEPTVGANQDGHATSTTNCLTPDESLHPASSVPSDCEQSDNEAPEKQHLLHDTDLQSNNSNNKRSSDQTAPKCENENKEDNRLNGPQLPAAQDSKSVEANNKSKNKKAILAKQESIFEAANFISNSESKKQEAASSGEAGYETRSRTCTCPCSCCCFRCKMFQAIRARRCLLIPLLLLVIYVVLVYSLPFVRIEPQTLEPLPVIPFDYLEGPLKPSSASAFKVQHLFKDQLYGPESLAFDSHGNMYTAIEGGFVMYAHLNRSSPIRRAYLPPDQSVQSVQSVQPVPPLARVAGAQPATGTGPELIKIAELQGPKQQRTQRDSSRDSSGQEGRRECQLDEQVYGGQLYTTAANLERDSGASTQTSKPYLFKSHVRVSRCSKPLGVRLSQDESYLYVIDTLNGLYRVSLRQAERPFSSQRLVTRLIDFRANNGHAMLPAIRLHVPAGPSPASGDSAGQSVQVQVQVQRQRQRQPIVQMSRLMNVSLKAIDDLTIDYNGGTKPTGNGASSADLIYMTVASQVWPATSFVFDHLEGRPSGLVLRYDTGSGQLAVLEPGQVAHVRNSNANLTIAKYYSEHDQAHRRQHQLQFEIDQESARQYYTVQPGVTLGAPRLDENDAFDDRPLNFPNGLELMDDRQALLIADTSNKRIIKHYIRGPRAGSSDLWAWTPHFPDNIRRGYDKRRETYWVVGCGHGPSASASAAHSASDQAEHHKQLMEINKKLSADPFAMLRTWPRVRKFVLKNIYLFGALIEFVGANVFRSQQIQDAGYELRTGSALCETGCSGMMILQYNEHGDIVRSIHSREFPNDLIYYSQVNEQIDAQNAEHALYLGSPSYPYVTKLTLPTELRQSRAPVT